MSTADMPFGLKALMSRKSEAIQAFQTSKQLADKFWTFEEPYSLDDAKALVDEVHVLYPHSGKLHPEMVIDVRNVMASDIKTFTHDCLGYFLLQISSHMLKGYPYTSKDVTTIMHNVYLAAEDVPGFICYATTERASPNHHDTLSADLLKLHDLLMHQGMELEEMMQQWHSSDAAPLFGPLDSVEKLNTMLKSLAPAQQAYGLLWEAIQQNEASYNKVFDLASTHDCKRQTCGKPTM